MSWAWRSYKAGERESFSCLLCRVAKETKDAKKELTCVGDMMEPVKKRNDLR